MPLPPVPDLPSRRQTQDELLRSRGWHIWARPTGKEAVWVRGDDILPQSEALKRVTKEVARGGKH
jgi:hypothetical protein